MHMKSTWNTSIHILSKEKRTKNWSIIIDITILLYPVISSAGDLVSASFKLRYNFFNKSWWLNNLKPNERNPRIQHPKIRVNFNYTLSNRYNGGDLMFLLKEGLSLIFMRLPFNSNRNFLLSLVSTLKHSKDDEWWKF